MKHSVRFVLENETRGALRYSEENATDPLIGTLYLKKANLYYRYPGYGSRRRADLRCTSCWIPRQEGRRRSPHARWFLDREQHAPDGSTYSLVPQCTHRDRLSAAMTAVEAVYDERILRALAGELVV